MPGKSIENKHRHSSRGAAMLDDVDDFRERDDTVTFFSKNKRTDTQFTASVPPGSQLSAAMARIAARVQGENLPTINGDYGQRRKKKLTATRSRDQIEDIPRDHSCDGQYYDHSDDYPKDLKDTYSPQHQPLSPHIEEEVVRNQPKYCPEERRRPHSDRYQGAARYELDRKVVYHAKGRGGELYVSAPVGSNEATLFDEIGRSMARKKNNCESGREQKKKHGAVERRSPWLSW